LVRENTDLATSRLSTDTDGDWVGEKITSEELTAIINNILGEMHPNGLNAVLMREPGESRSAGYKVYLGDRDLFGIDISFRRNDWSVEYKLSETESYIGATPNKIYADKMCAASNREIFRRYKDIYDLFLLSHLSGFKISELKTIVGEIQRPVGEFHQFLNNTEELRKGYDKLDGIINKPPFEVAYGRARDFVMPFITKSNIDGIWNVADGVWTESAFATNS